MTLRKYTPVALVAGGVVAACAGLWMLGGLALVLVAGGVVAVVVGLLVEV